MEYFDNYIGHVDIILLQISKPNVSEVLVPSARPKKFYCGIKCEFGLSTQGICDAKSNFLDVSIGYLGSTLDYLSIADSTLHTKLERYGFWLLV